MLPDSVYSDTTGSDFFKVIPNAIPPGISGQSSLASTLSLLVLLHTNFSLWFLVGFLTATLERISGPQVVGLSPGFAWDHFQEGSQKALS